MKSYFTNLDFPESYGHFPSKPLHFGGFVRGPVREVATVQFDQNDIEIGSMYGIFTYIYHKNQPSM